MNSKSSGSVLDRPEPSAEETEAIGLHLYQHDPDVLYGNMVPRIYTPELRPLTPDTSAGFAMIEFAELLLKWELTPWQKWFLIHAMELDKRNNLRFKRLLLLIARQNGKTFVVKLITIYRMYVEYIELVIGTAQSLAIAEDTWQEVVESIEDSPRLQKEVSQVLNGTGKKQIILKKMKGSKFTKSRYLCRPATKKGTRSLSAELVLLDELREHNDWDGWGAVTPTTAAKKNSQIIAMSNAGDRFSVVLNTLRKTATGRLGDPDELFAEDEELPGPDDTFGIFEWSAAPHRDIFDPVGYQEANPSMGYTALSEAELRGDASNGSETVFRTERLCQKVDTMIAPPFGKGVWEAGTDEKSEIPLNGKFVYGLDMDKNRSKTVITVAGYRSDGNIHVEIITQRPGNGWVKGWLEARQDDPLCLGVALQSSSNAAALLSNGDFDDLKMPVHQWGGSEVTRGTGALYDSVLATARAAAGEHIFDEKRVFHIKEEVLDKAACFAVKKPSVGGGFLWNFNDSPVDISPLNAVTAAVWALRNTKPKLQSAYENYFLDDDDDLDWDRGGSYYY